MSEYSSVRTSRVQSIAAKSIISSVAHSSRMSRITSSVSSVPTSKITAMSKATSHLTELLSSKIFIDEYGFTDKICRSCSNHLSIEEVIALTIPLDASGKPLCNIDEINFEEIPFICLSCYAEIVSKKNKARENAVESLKETPMKSARQTGKEKEPKVVKEVQEIKRLETGHTKSRAVSSNSSAYRKAARPVMPFASDPTKFYENIRKDKYNRKKTDLTQFANAAFTGGVFVNGIPGQSI